jgi:hypothetical protein
MLLGFKLSLCRCLRYHARCISYASLAQTATEAVLLIDSAVTVTCPRGLCFYRENETKLSW